MNEYLSPKIPLPEPLSGSVVGSFAHHTVTKRFPKIAHETILDNEFPPEINQQLEQLIQDIPTQPLRELDDPGAPDIETWQKDLSPFFGQNWLQVPWFVAEMYFYRRILEATGFHQAGPFQGYDPFWKQKKRVLVSASSSTINLASLLEKSINERQAGLTNWHANLEQVLVLNVWGNQADLSMWSAGEERPDHQAVDDQQTHLLANDASQAADFLSSAGKLQRVDFILDNYGPELIHDIGLADFLLSMDLAAAVRFHAKPAPHYVSDAMIPDIHSTLEYLAVHQEPAVRQLARRIETHIQDQRLQFTDNYFWTSPTYFWDMPEYVFAELSASELVISKGDANYRRLAGDLNWSPTTPFQDVMHYFPTSLLALRVLKAELALGISPSQVNRLDNQDPDWKTNGQWAVIQLCKK
jgi:uncharacterized protein with ATP-grasp and redox domains